MAFKGRPATSDLRGSASVNIARKLKERGYFLRLHDFTAYPEEMKKLNLGEVFEDLSEACKNSSALLILNNHKKYSEIEISVDCSVLDIWSVCKKIQTPKYFTIGNLLIPKEEK